MAGETRYQTTNQSFTWSKIPQQREKNVAKIVSLDVMELTMSRKTPAEQQTTYCFVNLVGCVQ